MLSCFNFSHWLILMLEIRSRLVSFYISIVMPLWILDMINEKNFECFWHFSPVKGLGDCIGCDAIATSGMRPEYPFI